MKILAIFCCFFTFLNARIYVEFDVLPKENANLVFETNGIVKGINVKISDIVKKGDILIKLDDTNEQIALKNAKNELENAKLVSKFAQNTLLKFNKVKNEISKQDFDKIEFEYKSSLLHIKKAELNIKSIENLIDKKSLKAPFDGIIVAKNIEIGDGVLALAKPVLELASTPEVKLVLKIDEKFINDVKIGDRLSINNSDKTAKISLIYPTINPANKKFKAEVYTQGFTIGAYGQGYIE